MLKQLMLVKAVLCIVLHLFSLNSFAQVLPCGGAKGVAHSNGGGFVASSAYVDSTVYVSEEAQVCGGSWR